MQNTPRHQLLKLLSSPHTKTQKAILLLSAIAAGSISFVTIQKLIRLFLSKTSVKTNEAPPKRKKKKLDKEFWSGLRYILKISIPSIKSPEVLVMIGIGLVQILITMVTNKESEVQGELLRALLDSHLPHFKRNLGKNVGLFIISSLLKPLLKYLIATLTNRWRKRLTDEVHKQYYSDMIYYKMNFLDKSLENPDKCVTQDIELYASKASNMFLKIIRPAIDLVYYSYMLLRSGGVFAPAMVFGYMGIAMTIIQLVTPNFGKLVAKREELEGNFRQAHSRIRTHGESIAVYGGDLFEKKIAEKRFESLVEADHKLINKKYSFGVIYDMLFKYFPHTIVWIICGVPIYWGRYSKLTLGQLIKEVKYVSSLITAEFHAVGNLFSIYRELLEFSGYTNRVAKMFKIMRKLFDQAKNSKYDGKYENGQTIKFENVSIITPTGEVLGTGLSFDVDIGHNTIITGPNGSGKSSLFRVLGGLWPLHKGTITKPGGDSSGLANEIFYVPQKPYNCYGTLRDQIMYPTPDDGTIPDSKFTEILNMVNLGKLVTEHGYKKRFNWSNLSVGEQQKLAMARLFFHKPRFAILDECTSGITLDDEKLLYDKCKELQITCITISHRPALQAYHKAAVKYDGAGNISYTKDKDEKDRTE